MKNSVFKKLIASINENTIVNNFKVENDVFSIELRSGVLEADNGVCLKLTNRQRRRLNKLVYNIMNDRLYRALKNPS